jgi:hypothetical protein
MIARLKERRSLVMGQRTFGIFTIGLICCIVIAVFPCASAEESLTRGSGFTVTITGRPGIAYYIWLARTFDLSGEPGDQPPLVEANQLNVVQDPPGGPYTIGSYRYFNGNGRTILDDVAPSSSSVPNTSYYAQVTTDSDGNAVVGFRTSSATAAKQFSVRAQNPQSPGETVNVKLGLPAQKATPTAAAATPQPATTALTRLPSLPPIEAPLPAPEVPVLPSLTSAVPVPTTLRQTPVELPLILAAAAAGLCIMRRSR